MNVVLEGVMIGFGVVGAVCAGKAAQTLVERSGGTDTEAMAAGAVGAGLAFAVLPAAVVAGACITVSKGVDAFQHRDALLANARTQFADAKRKVAERYPRAVESTATKVEAVKDVVRPRRAAKA